MQFNSLKVFSTIYGIMFILLVIPYIVSSNQSVEYTEYTHYIFTIFSIFYVGSALRDDIRKGH